MLVNARSLSMVMDIRTVKCQAWSVSIVSAMIERKRMFAEGNRAGGFGRGIA